MKISLAMIVRNAEETIIPCLLSIADYMDEIVIVDTGSTDNTEDAVMSVCPTAPPFLRWIDWADPNDNKERGWISDFSIPRNMSFDACTGDAILWLDADDIVVNLKDRAHPAAALRSLIETFMQHKDPVCDVIEMMYDYKHDEYGNRMADVPRYRVLRNRYFKWRWPVHEELFPVRFVRHVDWSTGDEYVEHRKRESNDRDSGERNLWIMERYMAAGGEMDARLFSNVAGTHLALGNIDKAIEAYDTAIEAYADDPDQQYICLLRLAQGLHNKRRFDESATLIQRASGLFPKRKHPYVALAENSMDAGNAEKALDYCDLAESLSADSEGHVQQTTALKSVPVYTRARALLNLGHHQGSLALFRQLAKQFPGSQEIEKSLELLGSLMSRQRLYDAVLEVSSHIPEERAAEMMKALPEGYQTFPAIARATKPAIPPDKPHLVIYCGRTLNPWGASAIREGIGGSEEGVILLSRELVAAGYHVEVYAFPPSKEQGWDEHGVVWLPYSAWEAGDRCDVFVGWRQHTMQGAFRHKLAEGVSQSWLWLHDTIVSELFSTDWTDPLDGIFCLSKSHAEWMPEEIQSKIHYTANGLDAGFIIDGKNEPHRLIYASSPDRGLECLLQEWPAIEEAVPGAILDVYYGFTPHYDTSMSHNPELRRIRESIEELRKAKGVEWHGMVDQAELAEAFAASGFWLYPTGWHETSCITAMKAQALGAIPITSRFPRSALPETCKYDLGPDPHEGIIYDNPEWRGQWRQAVIAACRNNDLGSMRDEMKSWAREEFSWRKVATQWDSLFKAKMADQKQSKRLAPTLLV